MHKFKEQICSSWFVSASDYPLLSERAIYGEIGSLHTFMRYICHKSWLALHVDIDIWSSSLFQSVRRRLNNKK
uniref:Uncharacterized protein n=1 Tax=Oryza glumipatula TaxID=40148 RepID=A0A0E0AJZ1_9ORYZ